MAKKDQIKQRPLAAETELPPGVKLLRILKGHVERVISLAFDPQSDTLASGSFDRSVRLWAGDTGKLLRTLKGHQGAVVSVAFNPQGQTLASGGEDHTVRFWDSRNGNLLSAVDAHHDIVWSLSFDPQILRLER